MRPVSCLAAAEGQTEDEPDDHEKAAPLQESS